MSKQRAIDLADQVLSYATHKGIMHLYTQNQTLDGRMIEVNNSELINFGSCSYLGLEREPRVIDACALAAQRYGTQFSSSRAYMSTSQYLELEALFTQLFASPCLVTPTTSLGHLAALPALIRQGDLVILDHQVHASVFQASRLLKAQGEAIEMIRHNDLDRLESLIREHRQKQTRVWYCIDGVYSMYGDLAPMDELYALMDRYPELYLYADDAHGMSWCGEKGRGTVRGFRAHHPQLVLAVSLNKAFGCAGGLLVFPTLEMKQRVRTCGGPLVFSGPIQPPMLGAAIASAHIHLSGEVEQLQQSLMEKIRHCRKEIKAADLPDVAESESPVFFIGTGEINAGINLIHRLHLEGYYVNAGIFPAVPIHNMGVRFTITNHVTKDDISRLIDRLAHHYPLALAEENVSSTEVANAFKLNDSLRQRYIARYPSISTRHYETKVYRSITEVESLWVKVPDFRGTLNVSNLKLLERVFAADSEGQVDHNHWLFLYLVIYDTAGRMVAIGVLSLCDIKTDMFSTPEVSAVAEEQRQKDPSLFISRTLMLGTPVTEGVHLYIDAAPESRNQVLKEFLRSVKSMQLEYEAEMLTLRDFSVDDWKVRVMSDEGFLVKKVPDTHIISEENISVFGTGAFIASLSKSHKYHWRKSVLPILPEFVLEQVHKPDRKQLKTFYDLYLKVQENALEISSFPLPFSFFEAIVNEPGWLCYGVKKGDQWVAGCFILVDGDRMYPLVLGMDPAYKSLGLYRACLYHTANLARDLEMKAVYFGITASLEKRRMGARNIPTVALVRLINSYQVEALDCLKSG